MKYVDRRSFLHGAIAAIPLAVAAQSDAPHNKTQLAQENQPDTNMKQAFVVVAPSGTRYPTGGPISVKVSGTDTGGALAVLEVPTAVDSGPSLHIHHVENEWFYALEGEYDIQVGEQVFHLKPGGSVYGPKLIPHTWHDVGSIPGKMLVVVQPAGHMEAFVEDLQKLMPSQMRDPAIEKALFEKYDIELAGPPLPKQSVK
jgi:mannose-6-phosphate isomerase-like protein (cupin superfamily)